METFPTKTLVKNLPIQTQETKHSFLLQNHEHRCAQLWFKCFSSSFFNFFFCLYIPDKDIKVLLITYSQVHFRGNNWEEKLLPLAGAHRDSSPQLSLPAPHPSPSLQWLPLDKVPLHDIFPFNSPLWSPVLAILFLSEALSFPLLSPKHSNL